MEKTIRLIEAVGPHICMLKLHIEFSLGEKDLIKSLKRIYDLKKDYNFILFEDRKFADGANTVQEAFRAYVDYVDVVTVLPQFGDGIFEAIEAVSRDRNEPKGCLAVCELSFKGVLSLNPKDLLEVAERHPSICVGIIAQKINVNNPLTMLKLTPGVNLSSSSDGKNQQWRGIVDVIADGADVIIVGRGITSNPEESWAAIAEDYKEAAYGAYMKNLGEASI